MTSSLVATQQHRLETSDVAAALARLCRNDSQKRFYTGKQSRKSHHNCESVTKRIASRLGEGAVQTRAEQKTAPVRHAGRGARASLHFDDATPCCELACLCAESKSGHRSARHHRDVAC